MDKDTVLKGLAGIGTFHLVERLFAWIGSAAYWLHSLWHPFGAGQG